VGLNPLGVPDPAFGVVSGRVDGFVAGGHIGFNWQISQIVLGAEVAGSWAELDGSTLCPNPGFTCHAEIDRLFRAGGRLGFAVNNWLIYGMGGWARARVATTATPFFFGFNDRHHHDGWYAGGGVEFGFAQNWIFGVEGFRVELDHENHAFPPFIGGASRRVDGDFWVIQGRLSYKFGFGGPVVARY
jgi:outer membrane immunogenic protein